jgi:hypothetical protein
VVAESVLLKHQLLILNRSCRRAPNLRAVDRIIAGFCALFVRSTRSRQAGIDPKLVADQLGHGVGVHLDVYTIAALDQRQQAVEALEVSLLRR